MKYYRLIVLILLLGITTAACQGTSGEKAPSTMPPDSGSIAPYPVSNQPPASAAVPYPVSNQPPASAAVPYPALSPESPSSLPILLYPELKDGDTLDWQSVEEIIRSGLVASVSQKHNLEVAITMKDGRTFLTSEPAIDDIVKLIQQCGDVCKDIHIATE